MGDEEAAAVPSPGVESIFLTGGTLTIVGLDDMGPGLRLKSVSKETLLADVQYRGAISDFTIIKNQIGKADCESLWVRYNEDDVYGDGNNFEVAVTKAAGEAFEMEDAERAVAAEAEKAAALLAAEEHKPGRKKKVKPVSKPWVSLGSELEIAAETLVTDKHPRIVVQVFRKRSHFGTEEKKKKLADVDAITLWNSASMECRPFKEKTPSTYFSETDCATQAVPSICETATQATPGVSKPMATQYEPRRQVLESSIQSDDDASREKLETSQKLKTFLDKVNPRMRGALQQNELYDIFTDDFASLADNESGLGGGRNGGSTSLVEMHSFTSLKYNKGKAVSCIDWAPDAFGVVAASCVETVSFEAGVASGGVSKRGAVLVWDFEDPIHPKFVLEAPHDVHAFQWNPTNPSLVAGGLANGQVCFWDLADLLKPGDKVGSGSGSGSVGMSSGVIVSGTTGTDKEKQVPVCQPKFVSEVQESHVSCVTDVTWLPPDVGVSKPRGEIQKVLNPTGVTNFFATTSADGKVLFWDLSTTMRKDTKRRDFFFNPTYKIALGRGEQSGAMQCVKISFSPELRPPARDGSVSANASLFFATSADGEVAQCDFVAPGDEDGSQAGGEHTKLCVMAHSEAVRSIARSPFFPDLVITVGASSFKLWREGQAFPIFSSPQLPAKLCGCAFSPTRPTVVFIAKDDGVVETWDLLDRSHEPYLATRVNSTGLGPIKFWTPQPGDAHFHKSREQLLAVGDAGGVLHVLRTPRQLRKPKPRELERTEAFLEREAQRAVDSVERGLQREAASASREDAVSAASVGAAGGEEKPAARRGVRGDKELSEDERREAEYMALEQAFMVEMGLREAPMKEE